MAPFGDSQIQIFHWFIVKIANLEWNGKERIRAYIAGNGK